jgi:GT2 family glycosyltransferase/glycosyltransferase involved in cell wall biosynthesis
MDYRAEDCFSGMASQFVLGRQVCARPLLIAIPFYKNEHLVQPVIGSLIACAAELQVIGAEAVFYVDSPGHAPLDAALDQILPEAAMALPCRIERNAHNLGFVRTMNKAVAEATERGMDLLLLNSDTVIEPGALAEMVSVLAIDHMIGFVNPRSNNATITTLPVRAPPHCGRARLLQAAAALQARLPRISYIPTAVGFCLLVRWNILAEFGGFDEIYGQGYNEENDLVMRASRCGYRAVMANRAFVWHEGEESFAIAEVDRSVWEPANRAILDARYPEYGGYTAAYYHAPETTAETLLAALTPDEHGRLDLAFDFSSFRAAHNGTFQAGLQLLRASRVWAERYRVHVICTREVYAFHDYEALGVPRCDPHEGRRFAAIFRVGQPYDWNVIQRLAVTAPVIGLYMLDTISIDCPQLTSARLYNIWQFALDHADLIATQSRQTEAQFAARFAIPPHAVQVVALHSLDVQDYALPGTDSGQQAGPGAGILVIGNHFHHKYLSHTANALAAAFPAREIVAMGLGRANGRTPDPMAPPPLAALPNLTPLPVGDLSDAEIGACYAACALVVFPSHAEGFGFPVLNALAARRPVFLRRLPVFQELWDSLGRTPNIHFYDATRDLLRALANPPAWVDAPCDAGACKDGAERCARQIRDGLDAAIARADYGRVVRRIRAMQLASDLSDTGRPPIVHGTQAAEVAQFLALRVERVARRALALGPLYQASRLMFRTARYGWRAVRLRR